MKCESFSVLKVQPLFNCSCWLDVIEYAAVASKLTKTGKRLIHWLDEMQTIHEPSLGLLSPQGVRELFDQGNRAHVRHQAFFDSISGRDIVVSATHKKRTHQSRDAWLHGFRAAGATPDDSVFKVRDPPVATDISEEAMKLRYVDASSAIIAPETVVIRVQVSRFPFPMRVSC